ncbi:hypothetical protein HDU93_007098 [Gonapodya sp. JEL0774]|nr:hypothetical protein HDU93_007098 [Gonapodya sp. JEL0774]
MPPHPHSLLAVSIPSVLSPLNSLKPLILNAVRNSSFSLSILVSCPQILQYSNSPVLLFKSLNALLGTLYVWATKEAYALDKRLLDISVIFDGYCGYDIFVERKNLDAIFGFQDGESQRTCAVVRGQGEQGRDSSLLSTKRGHPAMQSVPRRTAAVLDFLARIRRDIEYHAPTIYDPYGPTRTDPKFEVIVGSRETEKGCVAEGGYWSVEGPRPWTPRPRVSVPALPVLCLNFTIPRPLSLRLVNTERQARHLSTLAIFIIDVVSPDTETVDLDDMALKISSSDIREWVLEKRAQGLIVEGEGEGDGGEAGNGGEGGNGVEARG